MEKVFDTIIALRERTHQVLDELALKDLNTIPKGFSNNILWNAGHLMAVQQRLSYGLSGNTLLLSDELILPFEKGTKPEIAYSEETYLKIKKLLVCTAKDLKQDYYSGIFKSFTSYRLSLGITLENIEDAIHFIAAHEGMHYGYVLAQKKAVLNQNKGFFK